MTNEDINLLYAFESCVARSFRDDPELTDHAVKRVYEAAAARVRALSTGHPLKEVSLGEPEASLYAKIIEECESLESSGAVDMETGNRGAPASAETILQNLKKLARSVEKATKRSGVRGYLNFISQYVKGSRN